MPIIKAKWDRCLKENEGQPFGNTRECALAIMETLDDEPKDFDAHKLVDAMDRKLDLGMSNIGYMLTGGIIATCHTRGDEFRKKWNSGK